MVETDFTKIYSNLGLLFLQLKMVFDLFSPLNLSNKIAVFKDCTVKNEASGCLFLLTKPILPSNTLNDPDEAFEFFTGGGGGGR